MPAFRASYGGLAAMAVILISCCLPQRSVCSCHFPASWTGSWFQKGVQEPIRITNGTISNKGDCRKVDGDKFLLKSRTENCFRCVVIHEKHANVLQYKETFCSPSHSQVSTQPTSLQSTLDALCGEINGDALLFSMFRLHTTPVACPFRGPFTFTYSRGHGDCSHPVSTVDACTVDSRLLFRFQACADVQGSESRVEELVCLALWKEGSTRYFVGKLENKMAKTDEDMLRCFVYEREKEHSVVLLAQSGDATCDGLLSATEGSRTMKLTKATHPHAKCFFPEWMWVHRHWRTLDGNQVYEFFGHHNSSFRIVNSSEQNSELRVVCSQEVESTPDLVQLVVHSTIGCQSGYQCMRIHKRAAHVIEVQQGRKMPYASEACSPHHFEPHRTPFTTLTTGSPDSKSCPLTGIYSLEGFHPRLKPILASELGSGQCSVRSTVTAGCDAGQDRIQFLAECASDSRTRAFQCHGNWEENGTYYLIASAIGSRMKYCMTFTENDKVMQFSGSPDSCIRTMPISKDTYVTFNVTSKGSCHATGSSPSVHHISVWTVSLLALVCCLTFQRPGALPCFGGDR